MKWSEVFIVSFLEDHYEFLLDVDVKKRQIECVLSKLNPYIWVSPFDGVRYYNSNGVQAQFGLLYKDLEEAYANQGYGELI